AELDGAVYFAGNQSATGRELWRTDGTLAGTQLAVEVRPGPQGGVIAYHGFAAAEGRLWFSADDGTHGVEWWQSDGTGAGTSMVTDLFPGSAWSVDPFEVPKPRGVAGHVLLNVHDPDRGFALRSAQPGSPGTEVIQAAGDSAGSVPFCTLWNCPSRFTPTAGGVAFKAAEAEHGIEPWLSDGTAGGTRMVADVAPGRSDGMFSMMTLDNVAPLGDDLLLIASDCTDASGCDADAYQLWRATPQGALTQLTAEPWSLAPTGLASWNGSGFLGASSGL